MPGNDEQRHEHQHDDQRGQTMALRTSSVAAAITSAAWAGGLLAVQLEPAQHVLHAHHGVVHQFADGDGQAPQGHGVDGQAEVARNTSTVTSREAGMATSEISVVRVLSRKANSTIGHQDGAVAQGFALHIADG
jgi:hypothetical protein